MSALSGITISSDLASTFADAVQTKATRFIKVSIQNESLVHDLSVSVDGSFKDDLSRLQQDDILEVDSPAYILAKLDFPSSDWMLIYYVPETAQVREKMLYASTRYSLLKSLGSTLFTDSIFATSKSDLTLEAYASHLRHVAAPNPLSKREQEMEDLRALESNIASYESSRAKTSYVGTGIGLNWTDEVDRAIAEIGEDSGNYLVILAIDSKSESLSLHSAGATDISSLGSSLPSSEPCYALFAWTHSFTPSPAREIVFIYSCPSTSPIKNRMLYSSGCTSTYEAAKKKLASLSPAVTIASRKIETSDPKELDKAFLKAELGLGNDMASEKVENSKGFAKPKGPLRRR